jgi:hypothetical protein
MTSKELKKLAEYIANLVVEKLNDEFDFIIPSVEDQIENEIEIEINDLLDGTTNISDEIEEHLIAELARLTTLLTIYEDQEQYEKAAIIKNKIRITNKKLNND